MASLFHRRICFAALLATTTLFADLRQAQEVGSAQDDEAGDNFIFSDEHIRDRSPEPSAEKASMPAPSPSSSPAAGLPPIPASPAATPPAPARPPLPTAALVPPSPPMEAEPISAATPVKPTRPRKDRQRIDLDSRRKSPRLINVEFKDAKFKDVIKVIMRESGNNYVYAEAIGEKKVSVALRRVPWHEALEAILYAQNLGILKLKSGMYRIDELTAIREEDRKEDEELKKQEEARKQAAAAKLGVLNIATEVFIYQLSYSKAEEVVTIIATMIPKPEEHRGIKVQADTRTNSVIIEATPRDIKKIKSLISRIDLQTPQVKIKTRIIEVIRKNDTFLGINWAAPYRNDQSQGQGFGSLIFPNSMNSAFSVDTGIAPNTLTNRGAMDFHFGSINNAFELDVRLRMSELQRNTKTLQNNTFIVLNNQKAVIEAGSEEYFSVPQGQGRNELSSVRYSLKIEVTPHITSDGAIKMDIDVASASPLPVERESMAANKNLRNLTTNLIRKNNETAVIGGLYSTDLQTTDTGIPYLSKIPIIGILFKSKNNSDSRRELIIMVTPTIITMDSELTVDSFKEEMVSDERHYMEKTGIKPSAAISSDEE